MAQGQEREEGPEGVFLSQLLGMELHRKLVIVALKN